MPRRDLSLLYFASQDLKESPHSTSKFEIRKFSVVKTQPNKKSLAFRILTLFSKFSTCLHNAFNFDLAAAQRALGETFCVSLLLSANNGEDKCCSSTSSIDQRFKGSGKVFNTNFVTSPIHKGLISKIRVKRLIHSYCIGLSRETVFRKSCEDMLKLLKVSSNLDDEDSNTVSDDDENLFSSYENEKKILTLLILRYKIGQLIQTGHGSLTVTLTAPIVAIAAESIALSVGAIGRAARAVGANIDGHEQRGKCRSARLTRFVTTLGISTADESSDQQ
uniref:Uncharacterized protein n=1 Tax=Romanomermis culicivorax TaxID=13658 RepID=A0A915JIA2_ROMCU